MGRESAENQGGCSDFQQATARMLTRRSLMQFGGVSLLSSGLLNVLEGQAHAATRKGRIKSCLLLFQAGGVSQIDTFDMKPDCDATIRGEFRPIDSNVPGMHVCEHLPRMAWVLHDSHGGRRTARGPVFRIERSAGLVSARQRDPYQRSDGNDL
jgi:uncharacterized protein DUF1501